jgi:hypothetical protein
MGATLRSYAAIFDGHNGAGAAEVAAQQLHTHLMSHPGVRAMTGKVGLLTSNLYSRKSGVL